MSVNSAPAQPSQELLDAISQDIRNFYESGRHLFADLMDPVYGAFAPPAADVYPPPNAADLAQDVHFYLDDSEEQVQAQEEFEEQDDQLFVFDDD